MVEPIPPGRYRVRAAVDHFLEGDGVIERGDKAGGQFHVRTPKVKNIVTRRQAGRWSVTSESMHLVTPL